jgi:hypothetical protein
MAASQQKYKTFCTPEGDIFTSPNAEYLPESFPKKRPMAGDEFAEEYCGVNDFRFLNWSYIKYPFMPFTPKAVRFEGPLFSPLSYAYNSIPMEFLAEGNNEGWMLRRDIQEKWLRIEDDLRTVIGSVLVGMTSPMGFSPFEFPSSAFMRFHETKQKARRALQWSLNAFVPLIAMATWAILQPISEGRGTPSRPFWASILVDEHGMHPEYVESLRTSIVGDLTVERVGCILDPFVFTWLGQVPRMVAANAPVWIFWGKAGFSAPTKDSRIADEYRPSLAEVEAARFLVEYRRAMPPELPSEQNESHSSEFGTSTHSFSSTTRSSSVPSTSPTQSDTDEPPPPQRDSRQKPRRMPKPQPGSRQKPGETIHQFLTRRAERFKRIHERQTEEDAHKYAQRVKSASSFQQPGKKGPKVFKWVVLNGYHLRTEVPRGHVEDIWEDYSNSQKKYNPYDNEWDLCRAFDPHGIPDNELEWDEMGYYVDETFPDPPYEPDEPAGEIHAASSSSQTSAAAQDVISPLAAPSSSRPGASHMQSVLTSQDHQLDDGEVVEDWLTKPRFDSLEQIVFYRYGLRLSSGNQDAVDNDTWHKTAMILGDTASSLSASSQATIVALVEYFLRKPGHDQTSSPRRDIMEPGTVGRLLSPNLLNIFPMMISGSSHYLIKSMQPSSWNVVVSDPSVPLECLRSQWGPTNVDVARQLVMRGIPFKTLQPLPVAWARNAEPRPQNHVGLGWRAKGYKPDVFEYAAYEARRDAFLRQPHGRAALLAGGLVWRLAIEAIGFEPALDGPSEDALLYGSYLQTSSLGLTYDDALSADELDLICGVYHVYTGRKL